MKKISGKKMHGPTLQEIELVPITDPVRIAAIDRWRREVKKEMEAAEKKAAKRKTPKRK